MSCLDQVGFAPGVQAASKCGGPRPGFSAKFGANFGKFAASGQSEAKFGPDGRSKSGMSGGTRNQRRFFEQTGAGTHVSHVKTMYTILEGDGYI